MIITLNDNWTFFKDTAAPTANKAQAPAQVSAQTGEKVTLPHTWNAIDGQDGGSDYFRGECTYTRPLPALTLKEDEEAYLCFYGVSQTAEVFISGELVTRHEGGYSRFYADVTRFFRMGGSMELTVRVSNAVSDRVYPQAADFTFFGGIYRSVGLLILDRAHFDFTAMGGGVKITPKEQNGAWSVELVPYVVGGEHAEISWRILDGAKEIAGKESPAVQTVNIAIPDPILWQGVDDPHLYTLEAVLLSPEGKPLDTFSARFGLRTFSIDPERGFFLNGKSYPLRGVSRHQDRENMGYAITRREHEEDIALIRELGANSVRLAHYQHDDYFYSLCDEAGLVVWAEVPYITMELPDGHENILSQFRELITQNYNHTCIVCWGLSNEITLKGVTDGIIQTHAALKAIKEELDPYRPSTMAHISMLPPDSPFVETAGYLRMEPLLRLVRRERLSVQALARRIPTPRIPAFPSAFRSTAQTPSSPISRLSPPSAIIRRAIRNIITRNFWNRSRRCHTFGALTSGTCSTSPPTRARRRAIRARTTRACNLRPQDKEGRLLRLQGALEQAALRPPCRQPLRLSPRSDDEHPRLHQPSQSRALCRPKIVRRAGGEISLLLRSAHFGQASDRSARGRLLRYDRDRARRKTV